MTKEKLTELTVTDPITADIYKGLLESSDIPVFLRSHATSVVHPFTIGLLGDVHVMVDAKDLPIAQELIKEVKIENIPPEELEEDITDS